MKIDYKALFRRVWNLLLHPRETWQEIADEDNERRDVAMAFVFPLICFCGLATLIGRVVREGFADGAFMDSFMDTCILCFALMGTYYLSAWAINTLRMRYLQDTDDMPLAFTFTAYAMVVGFALTMLVGLFPELQLFKLILQFYVVYVVWLGTEVLLQVDEDKQMAFSLIVSAVILLVPFLLQLVFDKLTFIFG